MLEMNNSKVNYRIQDYLSDLSELSPIWLKQWKLSYSLSLGYNLEIDLVISVALLILFRIALTRLELLYFAINFRRFLYLCDKCHGDLYGIEYVNHFGRMLSHKTNYSSSWPLKVFQHVMLFFNLFPHGFKYFHRW